MRGKQNTRCCIDDDVSEYTRFTFTYFPGVDRWSERLAFTHMTQVVSKHLLKCHRARHWLPTSSRLLFCSRARPLTSLCQRRWASLWEQHGIVLFIFEMLMLHHCTASIYHHGGWVLSPCVSCQMLHATLRGLNSVTTYSLHNAKQVMRKSGTVESECVW